MLTNLLLLGLGFLCKSSQSCSSVSSDSKGGTTASPNILSLFSIAPGENITYPQPDTTGPEPRKIWIEAYECAKESGLIPDLPKSERVKDEAVYPEAYRDIMCNPGGKNRCNLTEDVINAPVGMAGISFDDGPTRHTMQLLEYLKSQSQKATHFLIGSRIMSDLPLFQALDAAGEHLAVHTFSHPMMTSLTDHEVVSEIGWTMQLVHDHSQKHFIPRYWRPPYGDVDQRVDAIARHVFGLETVMWRYDPRDWCLADSVPKGSACSLGHGPQSSADLEKELTIAKSDKQYGLIILEHEQSLRAITAFKFALPLMKKLQWIPKAIPDLFDAPWYQ